MSYTLHNFATGDTLFAADLNGMDEQIYANARSIENIAAVHYNAQDLSDPQKQQARKNIGALSREDVEALIRGDFIERDEITYETIAGGYWNKNAEWVPVSSITSMRTCLIPVQTGDSFAYSGNSDSNIPSVIWFDAEEKYLSFAQWSNPTAGLMLYTAPANASYARFYSYSYSANVNLNVFYLDSGNDRTFTFESADNGYWDGGNTWVPANGYGAKRTNPIRVEPGDVFHYTGQSAWNIYAAIFYGADGSRVYRYQQGANKVSTVTITPPDGAVLVRFYSFVSEGGASNCRLTVTYETTDGTLDWLKGMNCLWGKKYVACGDSFTQGDFSNYTDASGKSGTASDAYDPTMSMYKTYPWWIAQRNRMALVNEALCGSTMYNNGTTSAFSVSRYTQIPLDADYITLCFGLNETSAPLGTLSDSTNDTVIGAWNVVLEYLITNLPYAKIGIIIPDAWCTAAMRQALISVAEYWGIPYLDTTGDPAVPLLIGGKRGSSTTMSAKAISLRNEAFQVSAEDSHPNLKAHEYRSTVIEHFLRSL